jgi:5-hydroxyisourate hydrolase-like protein (transthyretin family)
LDANAAVIPRVEIQVFKRGSYPNNPVKTLYTNEEGRFSELLAVGIYTIVIHKPWFRSEVLAVEVAPDGSGTELRQTLQVGTDCDW